MAETKDNSKPKAGPPTSVLSWTEFYKATDNGNKLMDRVWYCIACTDADVGKQIAEKLWAKGMAEQARARNSAQFGAFSL